MRAGQHSRQHFFAQSSPPGSQISSLGPAFNYFASGTVPVNVSTVARSAGASATF